MLMLNKTTLYKAFSEENPKVIHITESKEDLALFHSFGNSAMIGNIQELTAFVDQNKSVVYVLAFNSSLNLRGYVDVFESIHVKYYALLPERGATWAETLETRDLSGAQLRGKIALAKSVQEVANLYHIAREDGANNKVFSFNQATYIIKLKDNNCTTQPLLNGIINPKYYVDHGRNEKYFIVELACKGVQSTTYKITHRELNTANKFMLWLRQHRGLFDKSPGYTQNINSLAEHIQAQPCVEIRKVEKIGFDSDSNCYVFPGFLYDKNGTRHASQEYGLFHEFALSAPNAPKRCHFVREVDDNAIPEQIIKDFYQAYGVQGIYLLGAYISSIFATEFDMLPLIENIGSDAHKHLNRMFFMDFDGIKLIQQAQQTQVEDVAGGFSKWLVTFEENNIPAKIKEAELKSRYHRQNINQASLFFHRSLGEFSTPEMLACSVTVECKESKVMKTYKSSELAVVGHAVMANRKYFEDALVNKTQQIQQRLTVEGIKEDVAFNHAILAAGAGLLIEKLGLDFIYLTELYDYAHLLAHRRTEQLCNRHPLADKFFETLFSKITIPDFNLMERSKAELATFSEGVAIMGNKLLFTMPLLLESGPFKQVFSQGYTNRPPQLFNQLQLHPAYIMRDHRLCIARPSPGERKHQVRYWVFDLERVKLSSAILNRH